MQEENVVLEASEEVAKEANSEKETAKRGWVRFKDDRQFGSTTGSEFRLWGDE